MPVNIDEISSNVDVDSDYGSFRLTLKINDSSLARFTRFDLYMIADGNGGRWRLKNATYVNLIAWDYTGNFNRVNHSLSFFSDDSSRLNSSRADFILDLAPLSDLEDQFPSSGQGKINNPRNPAWKNRTIEWKVWEWADDQVR